MAAATADQFIGASRRTTHLYGLVYRSIDHRDLRDLSKEMMKSNLSARYAAYAPKNGFGSNIAAFATAFVDLQEKRHAADYDPQFRVSRSDALLALKTARAALRRFRKANRGHF